MYMMIIIYMIILFILHINDNNRADHDWLFRPSMTSLNLKVIVLNVIVIILNQDTAIRGSDVNL